MASRPLPSLKTRNMNGQRPASAALHDDDDLLLDEEGAEPEAWEDADQLLADMKALTSSLLKAEAAITDREVAADEQKDHLHDGLSRDLASIVAAVAAGEEPDDQAPAEPGGSTVEAAEAAAPEQMHIFPAQEAAAAAAAAGPRAEAVPPHAPTREPLLEAAPSRRGADAGGG